MFICCDDPLPQVVSFSTSKNEGFIVCGCVAFMLIQTLFVKEEIKLLVAR
jgi:hypothetical protein